MSDPASPEAHHLARLAWLLIVLGGATYVLVFALVMVAVLRRGRRRAGERFILVGGLLIPTVVLSGVAFATAWTADRIAPSAADRDGTLHITVDGVRWWWRVTYPDDGIVTANEIHVPLDRPVDISLVSSDVIHSLWVPELNGKVDLVPGQTNHLHFTARRAGRFQGYCAEFCGLQHAHMLFVVVAESAGTYAAWAAANAAPRTAGVPAGGEQLFTTMACAGCHTVRGTTAGGTFGPDLTHLGSRSTLAAGTLPNTPDALRRWLDDTQGVKPGALMPELDLTPEQIDALVAYLEALT